MKKFERSLYQIMNESLKQTVKQVGLSRATLDSQVKVFHFDLTELPSIHIQCVK